MKKKISLLMVLTLATLAVSAETWVSDRSHSKLGFSISHMVVSHVSGSFKQFEVKAVTSKADYSDVKIDVVAQIQSINTDDDKRDAHLQTEDFFNSKQFPTLTFKSTSVTHVKGKAYKLKGNLTMHGVTKPVVLDLIFEGKVTNPMNKKVLAAFTVKGVLKRSAFAIGAKFPAAMLGDDVTLDINAELSPAN